MGSVDLKLMDAIPRNGFLGFVVALVVFFVLNVPIAWGNLDDGAFLFLLYFSALTAMLVLGINRPGIMAFMKNVVDAILNDTLDSEQKIAVIRSATLQMVGLWADLSQKLAAEQKEIKTTVAKTTQAVETVLTKIRLDGEPTV